MRQQWGKSPADPFEGFSWFLNAIMGRGKGSNQEERGKKVKKMETGMKEKSERIVELKPYPSSVVLCSWVLPGDGGPVTSAVSTTVEGKVL